MSVIKIRAHHLLCFQGYQGYGYSERFKANLEKTIKFINTSDPEVEIVAENDLICDCCPHLSDTRYCKDEASSLKIKTMDLRVLKKLDLAEGSCVKSQDLNRLVHAKFKTYLDIQPICGDCQWQEKCLWFQKFNARY